MMKNRMPRVENKQVPRSIRSEFDTLMWYKRAAEELKEMDSPRARALLDTLSNVTDNPSVALVQHGTSLDNAEKSNISLGGDIPSTEFPRARWYDQNVIPDSVVEVLANFSIRDLSLLLIILSVILLTIRAIHPN